LREEYCWLVAAGWFVVREKYCWLVADKASDKGEVVTPTKEWEVRVHDGNTSRRTPLHCQLVLCRDSQPHMKQLDVICDAWTDGQKSRPET
jgi:hypothetical protein